MWLEKKDDRRDMAGLAAAGLCLVGSKEEISVGGSSSGKHIYMLEYRVLGH